MSMNAAVGFLDVGPTRAVTVIRWAARLLSLGLFFLWGAFFVEHLEWFTHPDRLPPPWVFGVVGLHLAMLLSLLAGWRYERLGGALLIATASLFFFLAAGRNAIPFAAVTSLPGVLWLICAGMEAGAGRRS
ncbi:MAG: hypothetical protein U0835_03575 [Isosphaeraceae bacterium]